MPRNIQVILASRPGGAIEESNFRILESDIPRPGAGAVLVKNLWLSVDPYMRGRMGAGKSYAKPAEVGEVMVGGTVGEIVESNHPKLKPGDFVVGALGWQLYATSSGHGLTRVDPKIVPLSTYLGVCGMPGATAYIGLLEHCGPRAGETVLVSAATGAVGSVVGQLARLSGCRAVGIAGGKSKCSFATCELRFDACVDYRAGRLVDQLKEACPEGVDCCFENVGGDIMDAALSVLNPFSRVALCGTISDYNAAEPYGIKMLRSLLINRVRLQGFIVSDRPDLYQRAVERLTRWVSQGTIKYHETVVEGLASAPRALIDLFHGRNLGKQLVKLA